MDIKKFVRKSDNIEVNDDEVLVHLIEKDKDLWLVALAKDEEEEEDDIGIIYKELHFLKSILIKFLLKSLTAIQRVHAFYIESFQVKRIQMKKTMTLERK